MAHELETVNGKTSFASTQVAWHGLGQIVKEAMTTKQAIELGGLGYEVVKKPIFTEMDGVGRVEIPEQFATVRKDNNAPLGVVGSRYTIVQNADAFTFFDAIVGQGQAIFETSGVLGRGERIFVTAKMPNYVRIANTDDITEVFVVLTNSHDGSGSVICAISPIRVVCANTLRMSLNGAINKVAIRHTKSAESNLAQAHKVLGICNTYTEQMNATVNALALKPVSDVQVKKLLEGLFPSTSETTTRIDNIRNEVLNSYYTGIGQDKIVGTAWGVLNGITHYTSHIKSYKDADSKFTNLLMDGNSSKIAEEAVKMLVAL
jgi:phage/plasmid-like protein (TIGR03299 family)